MRIVENYAATLTNPLNEKGTMLTRESAVSDFKVKNIGCIYSMFRALNSGRLTRNFTFYPRETLVGRQSEEGVTGYASYVLPYGKPIIREHRLQADMWSGEQADVPMGRTVYSAYVKRAATESSTPHPKAKKGYPGTVEGDGYMRLVAAISDEEAIPKVLGGAYNTVSVGSDVQKVVESISGVDLVKARAEGGDYPEFRRGQVYEGKLSYWSLYGMQGAEMSFVNNPSDERAGTENPDIGEFGLQMLLAQKKMGKGQEFSLFDPTTGEKMMEFDLRALSEGAAHLTEGVVDLTWDWKDSVMCAENVHLTHESVSDPHASIEISPESTQASKQDTEMADKDIKTEEKTDQIENSAPEKGAELEVARKLVEGSKILSTHNLAVDESFLTGDSPIKVQNSEAFKTLSDHAVEVFGEWTVESAKYALISYLLAGDTVLVEGKADEFVTAGVLWGLDESHELFAVNTDLTWAEYTAMPSENFKGEGRTVPVHTVAARLLGEKFLNKDFQPLLTLVEYENGDPHVTVGKDLKEHALKESIEYVNDLYKTEFKLEGIQQLLEMIHTDHAQLGLVSFKTQTTELTPYKLTYQDLREMYAHSDIARGNEYLTQLVGVCRQHNISREQIESAHKVYSHLGPKVLEKLLASIESSTQHTEQPQVASQEQHDRSAQLPSESETSPIKMVQHNVAACDELPEDVKVGKSAGSWKESTNVLRSPVKTSQGRPTRDANSLRGKK